MTDFATFERHSPGATESGLLALVLVNEILCLLREREILTADNVVHLLDTTAHELEGSPSAYARRGAQFLREAMLPEHEIG